MELSVSGQRRRAAQIAKTAPQTERKTTAETGSALRGARTDKQEWSQTALNFLQEVNRQDLERQRKALEAKQQGDGELDCLNKALKTMEKCQKIAARIMKGDRVPPQDEQFLMEADPDGYKLAIVCRKPKEKPKEWESVLEDEEQENGSGGESAEAADSSGETAEA